MPDKLAIDGGPKVRSEPFPRWPMLGPDDAVAVAAVLESGKLTQLTGPSVEQFEERFAAYHGAPHCVATSSGTTAIHAALIALGVDEGDEVIVPAHTFIASATPVLHQRAVPVFADVDERTFCISPDSVRERITGHTKAIVAVHLNGHSADLDPLLEIANERGIPLIEDAAQAHGAKYKDRFVGTIGAAGCFSFWEDKIITTGGEGGAIFCGDPALVERMQRIRHHGEGPMESNGQRAYYHLDLGYNYRMTSMQAATGLTQLHRLDEYLIARRRNASLLTTLLADVPHIQTPFVANYAVHSYYKYICRLSPDSGIGITRFVAAVAAEGLPISRRYPTPLPQQPVFRHASLGGAPCLTAERLTGELFTLLVHPTASVREMEDYAAAISKVVAALAR
ncbi:MAG: DegT/DnrJ/EryC1/StrS family aminotransferase [Chloroflexota bacterium]